MSLQTLKIITSVIAPMVAFALAILNGFTEKRKEVEVKQGDEIITKKVLSVYGKFIIALSFVTALVILSGIYIDRLITDQNRDIQKKWMPIISGYAIQF